MRAHILSAAAAAAMLIAPAAVQAQDTELVVTTNVENYCSIGLANVAGSTVAVANGVRQKVTTLRMSCNSPSGAALTSVAENGDLKSADDVLINYDWELVVPAVASLGFGPEDTFPSNWTRITNSGGYSEALADGVFADLFLNLCYGVPAARARAAPRAIRPTPVRAAAPMRRPAPARRKRPPAPIRRPSPST